MWRLNRAWQFEGGGAVTGDLRIDYSGIASLITDTDHLRLLMDADGTFANASLVAGVYAGGVFHAAGQAPPDGSWYTVGELAMLAIAATASEHGMINPSGAVAVVYGGATNFVITPDEYWHVDDVTTNGGSVGAVTEFTWTNVIANGTIHADFAADLAALGTPHWWLASYGLTNGGASFDEAETNDPDIDFVWSWQEWIADTDPTNSSDYFHVTQVDHANSMDVVFGSSTARIYSLQSSEDMVDGSWSMVDDATNVAGDVSGTTTLTDTNDAGHNAYRIGVSLP
ncbi:MAG: hypothetical protein JXB04_00700, partial [Kiritimatiellae bacterium]|nr:hypothetical protein [Kiritimatiellia bacterium]